MFEIPDCLPRDDAPSLWTLQHVLLAEAETQLGARDTSKNIYQPIFQVGGPQLVNTPELDGAFAALSNNAGGFWPTAIYELAHETVHLLNPVAGYTNWLEEGIAVAFSLHAQRVIAIPQVQLPQLDSYKEALALVQAVSNDPFTAAKAIRNLTGALSTATAHSVMTACPGIDENLATRLCQQCIPR